MIYWLSLIIPLKLHTYYGDEGGRLHFVVWWQWAGQCFSVLDCVVDHVASGPEWQDRYREIQEIRRNHQALLAECQELS